MLEGIDAGALGFVAARAGVEGALTRGRMPGPVLSGRLMITCAPSATRRRCWRPSTRTVPMRASPTPCPMCTSEETGTDKPLTRKKCREILDALGHDGPTICLMPKAREIGTTGQAQADQQGRTSAPRRVCGSPSRPADARGDSGSARTCDGQGGQGTRCFGGGRRLPSYGWRGRCGW